MKALIGKVWQLCCVAVALTVLTRSQWAEAGWSGSMNGTGYGWSGVNVLSSTGNVARASTSYMTGPSAAISPAGYAANASLPWGSSPSTTARIKGSSGYVWQANTVGYNGDSTDNAELESRVTIRAADCPTLTMDSMLTPGSFDGRSGTITVNAVGTAGTALWLRGYEYPGNPTDVPLDNPATPENETAEFLKLHGSLKFEALIVGPFEFGGAKCPLIIPFTVESGDLEKLIFLSDGVSKSNSITIACPPDVELACGEPYAYPGIDYEGCGRVAVTFDPPAPEGGVFPPGSFPVGTTEVTVTATGEGGMSASCTFNVVVRDAEPPMTPTLADVTGQCSVNPPAPTTSDDCAGTVTGTTTTEFPITAEGTTVVTWTFDDGNGNVTTATQNMIVRDTTPPVQPTLADVVVGQCAGAPTAPTTTDNCAGTVTGTTTTEFPITVQGTTVVTWTFADGNGNSTTATQNVIVRDTTPPARPTLADVVVGQCAGTPTAPTTTDNCSGTVTGTTTTEFPITAQGTTVVTWTFDDGNGNAVTATQNVIVDDTIPPVQPVLADVVVGQCSGTPAAPTTTDDCAGTVTGTTTTAFPITAQGTTAVTWTFNDGNGNVTTATQNVIVRDTTPPERPTLPDVVVGQCSGSPTVPTTTDNCAGTVTGTTTTAFPITAQGTTVVTWTFDDGNGNVTTATQTVTVDDTIPPATPTLADVTSQCSVTLPAPTTTDDCAGTVTGTTTTVFPITAQGMTVVTWTFDDGNGNVITATQNVTVDDTIPPAVGSLGDYEAACGSEVLVPVPETVGLVDNCGGAVTVSPDSPQIYSGSGEGVTWTFTDAAGNATTVLQKVLIKGLVFNGFDAPISGTSPSPDCGTTIRTITRGSKIPLKFDTLCNGTPYLGGQPHLRIQLCPNTVLVDGDFQLINNRWHFNWDTDGFPKGNYVITATLQDGSKKYAVIRLK